MTAYPVVPAVLYHYTCRAHGEAGIRRAQKIRPYPHLLLGHKLTWMTDMEIPDQWALGLTQMTLCCNRTEVRVTIKPHKDDGTTTVVPWWYWARIVPRVARDLLEDIGLPMHWWVSPAPVDVQQIVDTSVLLLQRKQVRADV